MNFGLPLEKNVIICTLVYASSSAAQTNVQNHLLVTLKALPDIAEKIGIKSVNKGLEISVKKITRILYPSTAAAAAA